MQSMFRCCLAAALAATLCELPMPAATTKTEKPLGVVFAAERAHFSGIRAQAGTTVYAGDALDTEEGGTLALRVGAGQIFLLSESSATFAAEGQTVRMELTHGTTTFSTPTSGEFEIATPAGLLRGVAGKASSGRVMMVGPAEMTVAAYGGDLLLDNDGELHTIAAGKAYRVVIEESNGSETVAPDDQGTTTHTRRRRKKLAFYLIFAGAAGGIGYAIAHHVDESPHRFE
jgi:hypothetical protein